MSTLQVAGESIPVNAAGYLTNFDDWSEDVAREIARIDLPLSTYTQWYWKVDLHNLFHFLRLRADVHAQAAYADAYPDATPNTVCDARCADHGPAAVVPRSI